MAEIRDNRQKGWYWVDNAILETYGAKLGPFGIAVYSVLAFRANNNTQRCWPGHADIARLTGASVAQVKRALKTLKDLRLIDIETRRRGDGWDTNLYTLLEVPGDSASQTSALPDPTRSVLPEPRVGSGSTTNKTHEQDSSITTHIQV